MHEKEDQQQMYAKFDYKNTEIVLLSLAQLYEHSVVFASC